MLGSQVFLVQTSVVYRFSRVQVHQCTYIEAGGPVMVL